MEINRISGWKNGIGLLLVCASLLTACNADSIDKEAVLRGMANERIERFRTNNLEDCREQVLEAANLRADSLLLERARRMRLLANRPPKPQRPGAPPERSLSEELPLRPLFPYEVRFDTVLRQQLTMDSLLMDTLQYVDTLECVDCYLWANNDLSSSSEEEPAALDSLPAVLDIYQLLCGLQVRCLEDNDYSRSYQDQLYEAILRRPRAFELCLQILDPEGSSTGYYLNPLAAPREEPFDFESLLEQVELEIVAPELRQQLEAIVDRAKAGY